MKAFLIFISVFTYHPGFEIDYEKVFGENYTWAVNWLQSNNEPLEKYAREYALPVKELKAIIFPELIRYNKVFDAIEIESLKYLYVSEGAHYADFSVGYFQMKPSFAEMVEKDAVKKLSRDFLSKSNVKQWESAINNEDARRARVKRITNINDQIIYLCAFYKICQDKFSTRHFASAIERVKFFATCYNAGYNRKEAAIMGFQARNNFYKYNYSAVSAYYFNSCTRP
jgi:hypothetical protein